MEVRFEGTCTRLNEADVVWCGGVACFRVRDRNNSGTYDIRCNSASLGPNSLSVTSMPS